MYGCLGPPPTCLDEVTGDLDTEDRCAGSIGDDCGRGDRGKGCINDRLHDAGFPVRLCPLLCGATGDAQKKIWRACMRLDCCPASVGERLISEGACREREGIATDLFYILDKRWFFAYSLFDVHIVVIAKAGGCINYG
jgi:hypothetical protein